MSTIQKDRLFDAWKSLTSTTATGTGLPAVLIFVAFGLAVLLWTLSVDAPVLWQESGIFP